MQLVVGRITRPHGVRGEVSVEVRTDEPDRRFAVGRVLATDPAAAGPLTVESARWHSGRLLIRFAGIIDRNQAEDLRGIWLTLDSAEAGPTDDPDEFHDHELIGLAVVTTSGEPVGRVTDVRHFGQDLLVIEPGPAGSSPESQPGPAQSGPAQSGPAQSGPARPGPAQSGPARPGPAQAGPAPSGPAQVGPAQAGPAPSGLAQVGPAQAGPAPSGPAQAGRGPGGPALAAGGRTRGVPDGELLVPFVAALVPEVDVAAGRLVIDPPPGLLELATGEPGPAEPAQSSPAQNSPAQGSPAQGSPAQGSPAQGSPAQGSPAQGSPAGSNPARSGPAGNGPAGN